MNTFIRVGLRWLAVGAVVPVIAGTSLGAASSWRVRQVAARNLMSAYNVEPLASDGLRDAERAFLSKAVETARQQMRLAEIGVSQAESSEVRSHASQLASDYRELSETLDALIRRKGGIAGAPTGNSSETFQRLAGKSGVAFDREFVRTVAQTSGSVMTLFENAAADSRDTDVRDLAASELPVLRAHRNTVENLKKSID